MPLPPYIIRTSSNEVPPQIRLLLVGPPKSGKTYAASSFPNPLFVDFDNGLTSTELRAKNLATLPFYDEAWLRKQYPVLHANAKLPVRPASSFVTFLNSPELLSMSIEDTLVLDSLSTMSDAVKTELTPLIPVSKKTGEDDGYWFWKQWSNWFCSLCTKIRSLNCNVVLTAHEQEIRDSETGRVLAYKFMLQGQEFSPRLPQFFTDIYRQTKDTKQLPGPAGDKLAARVSENYLWQIKSSPQFLCETRMRTDKQFVPANFTSLNYK